ncbi:hypothetical protein HYX15_02485 [Candidatus Woesearchaeota archaeon]|nr:hypothetical protein [Candidatus Woesearchaeota archaeon]
MGTWESSKSRIEVRVEDHTKIVRIIHEEMPQGVNERAYLNRRFREEVESNRWAYEVRLSYKGQRFTNHI